MKSDRAAAGLLVIRIVLGFMFVYHGAPKLFGGSDKWVQVGGAMASAGISFGFVFWGFMAAFAEFFGGLCLVLGLFFRVFSALLFITMAVAARMLLAKGSGLSAAGHPLELAAIFAGLYLIGPGPWSLDALWRKKRSIL